MPDFKKIYDYQKLSNEIISISNSSIPRFEFFRKILDIIKEYSKCSAIEITLDLKSRYSSYIINESNSFSKSTMNIEELKYSQNFEKGSFIDSICYKILKEEFDPEIPFCSYNGCFWYSGKLKTKEEINKYFESLHLKNSIDLKYEAIAILPIRVDNKVLGLLKIMSKDKNYLDKAKIKLFEGIVRSIIISTLNKRAQGALRERVKELTCLYEIAKVSEDDELSLGEMLTKIVNLIPPAWQYPEITIGEIILDTTKFTSNEILVEEHCQKTDIVNKGVKRGHVRVIYTKKKPELDEGPYLKEERSLINAIAKQIGLIVERSETEQEKTDLQEQIRHADRLATIGQLAAGMAHELNEPLGSILGFSQLAKKYEGIPLQVVEDIDKIINASLHAREIIKKLMLFSRQMPSKRENVSINKIVKEGLYFFEARCTNAGINLIQKLDPTVPEIEGDSGQLNQVLINLVVNSFQAMPNGGDLFIKTSQDKDFIYLIIEDTGLGIDEEIKSKIFIPFFTTKDVNEGTGLGLAVVHGIIASHNGSINFKSNLGQGTKFEIKFPKL